MAMPACIPARPVAGSTWRSILPISPYSPHGGEETRAKRAVALLTVVVSLLCTTAIAVTLRATAARSPLSSPPSQAFHTATGGPDAFGYTWDDTVPFAWVDARAGGTQADVLGDNATSDEIPLGFAFPFYENSYANGYLSTNGLLTLGGPSPAAINLPLPSPFAPGNLIAPFWDDLCVTCEDEEGKTLNVGKVFYRSGGAAPNRYFVAEWFEVSRSDSKNWLTFEVVLYENGDILFQYGPLNGDVEQCTVGIQNATGSDGLLYLYREPGLAQGKAVKFIRPPDQARGGLHPAAQGQLGTPGQVLSYTLQIQNLGDRGTDTFDLAAASAWPVRFYNASDTAPLLDTDADGQVDSGPLLSTETTTITVHIDIPGEANVGDWDFATVSATSSIDPSQSNTATFGAAVPPTFAQAYTEGWDPFGALDGEVYVKVFHPDGIGTAQLTWNHTDEASATIIRRHDGRLVSAWERTYWNRRGHRSSDIEYAILDTTSGEATGLGVTDHTYSPRPALENSPALATASNGNLAFVWTRRLPPSWPPGVVDPATENVFYAVHSGSGQVIRLATALSRNGKQYSVTQPITGTARDFSPAVAATDDDHFVIAWQHESFTPSFLNDVYYAVVDANGGQIQPPTALITDTDIVQSVGYFNPRVLSLPNAQALILWDNSRDIQYAVLNSAGEVTRPAGNLMSGLGGDVRLADAAVLPNGHLFVTWTQDNAVAYATFDSGFGTVFPATVLPNLWSDANYAVSVSAMPQGQVVLTWQDGASSGLYYALVAGNGQLLTPPMPFAQPHEDWITVSGQGHGLVGASFPYVEPTPTPPPADLAPRTVLAELFSAPFALYGAAAENALSAMVGEHGLSQLAALQYFFSTAPGAIGSDESDRRGIWYGVYWPPAAFFDGTEQLVLPSENPSDLRVYKQYRGVYEFESRRPSPLRLSLTAQPGQGAEGEEVLQWSATMVALTDIVSSDLMFRCYLYEDPVNYQVEGEAYQARFVVRALAHEEPVTLTPHAVQYLQGQIPLAVHWAAPRLRMVALVQDNVTGEVLQAAESSTSPPVGPTPTPSEPMVEATLQSGLPHTGTVAYTGVVDTYISAYDPYLNYAGDGRLRVKGDGSHASLIHFELPEYMHGHMVYQATLHVYNRYQGRSQPCVVGAYRLRRPWVADEATWYNAAEGQEWTSSNGNGPSGPGPGDVDADPLDWRSVSVQNRWYTFDVTKAVRDWAFVPDQNHGLVLKGDTSGSVEIYFDSSNTAGQQQEYRPKLHIRYGEGLAPPTPTPTPTPTTTPTRPPATATPTPSPTPTGPTPTPTATPMIEILQQEVSPDLWYAGTKDTYISAEDPRQSFATSPMRVKGDARYTALVRFELPEWLIGHTIHYAGLEVHTIRRDKALGAEIGVYQVRRPWVDSEATWFQAASGQPWGLAGASGTGDRSYLPLDRVNVSSASAAYRFDVTGAVGWWAYDPETNHGLLLAGTRDVPVTYDFASSEYAQQKTWRPKLVIVHSEAPATPTPTATATWTATPTATLTASPSPTGTLETPSPTVSPTDGSWRCYLPIVVKIHLAER